MHNAFKQKKDVHPVMAKSTNKKKEGKLVQQKDLEEQEKQGQASSGNEEVEVENETTRGVAEVIVEKGRQRSAKRLSAVSSTHASHDVVSVTNKRAGDSGGQVAAQVKRALTRYIHTQPLNA